MLRRAKDGVRLLGDGEIKAKVALSVFGASKSAVAAVEKAGGTVEILAPKRGDRANRRPDRHHIGRGTLNSRESVEAWHTEHRRMVSAAEQLAANLNFGGARQGRRAEEAHLVHARRAAGLSARHLHPAARHRSERLGPDLPVPVRRHSGHVQHVRRRRHPPHGDLRAQHHALHLGLDHHPADDDGVADPRTAQERGRGGPQDDQPVHPLSDGGAGGVPGLRHRGRARRRAAGGRRSGPVLSHLDRDHAHRRHHVPDVARRADHPARHRQRHLAHHHVGHRRAIAVGHRRHARTRPPGRAVDRPDPHRAGDGGRGHHLHRVHGARAAPAADPVSQAPGRQPHVRGPVLASAAQAQYVGRHSADLRLVAAAVADDDRQFHRRARARAGSPPSPRSSPTAGRCFCCSMSA